MAPLNHINVFRHIIMIETKYPLVTNHQFFLQSSLSVLEKTKRQTLSWRQPKRFKRNYLLKSEDKVVGSLIYNGNNFIRRGIAGTEDGELSFKYSRFSLPKVTISTKGNLLAEVILEANWGWHGSLDLPGGYQHKWKPSELFRNQYHFTSSDNYPIVTIKSRFGFFKFESEVDINPAGINNPHLSLLSTLGWFLVLIRVN
jgi:hypothetical protein